MADRFYIQEAPKEPWHIESDAHCEYMLCGLFVSVEANVKISTRPGHRLCADCGVKQIELEKVDAFAPHAPRRARSHPLLELLR